METGGFHRERLLTQTIDVFGEIVWCLQRLNESVKDEITVRINVAFKVLLNKKLAEIEAYNDAPKKVVTENQIEESKKAMA
jgi:hypothetical protein